jgi:transposase-like protein
MTEQRKTSTAELKREAVRLMTAQRYGVAATARHWGIHVHRLRRWQHEDTAHPPAALPGNGPRPPAQEARRQLRDEGKR